MACSCCRIAVQSGSIRDSPSPHEGVENKYILPLAQLPPLRDRGIATRDPYALCQRIAEADDGSLDAAGRRVSHNDPTDSAVCFGGTRNAGGLPTSKAADENAMCGFLEGALLSACDSAFVGLKLRSRH